MNTINVNVNNTIVTTDFNNINFSDLKIGQQIFHLEEKEEETIGQEYSDLTAYCLCEKPLDVLYSFSAIQSNFDIYEYSDERMEMESDVRKSVVNYLNINNTLIEITDYDYEDIEYWNSKKENVLKLNDSNFVEKMTSSKVEKEQSFNSGVTKVMEIYKVLYRATFKLEKCSLAVQINYEFNPTKSIFYKRMKLYLFDENTNKYIVVTLDVNNGMKNLIKVLTKTFNTEDIQNCINHLYIYNCNIDKLRYNVEMQQTIFNTFANVDFGNNTIQSIMNTFILPFYEDKEINCQAYIKEFYSFFSHEVKASCPYNLEYSDDIKVRQKIKEFKCKSNSILEYNTGESYIDIYTGEILAKESAEIYRDAEILNIKVYNQNVFYKKIDNIFARLYDHDDLKEAKETIEERIKISKLLSN